MAFDTPQTADPASRSSKRYHCPRSPPNTQKKTATKNRQFHRIRAFHLRPDVRQVVVITFDHDRIKMVHCTPLCIPSNWMRHREKIRTRKPPNLPMNSNAKVLSHVDLTRKAHERLCETREPRAAVVVATLQIPLQDRRPHSKRAEADSLSDTVESACDSGHNHEPVFLRLPASRYM